MTLKTATPAEVLALPMQRPNAAKAATVGDYLITVLATLWHDPGSFSGKYAMGDSDWDTELYIPLVKAELIRGTLDEYGDIDADTPAADKLIAAAIEQLRTCIRRGEEREGDRPGSGPGVA